MDEGSKVVAFPAAVCAMIASPDVVRPDADEHLQRRKAMGRFEHENKYQVLSMEAEDKSDDNSLAEPLVDSEVEISDPKVEEDDGAADQEGQAGS